MWSCRKWQKYSGQHTCNCNQKNHSENQQCICVWSNRICCFQCWWETCHQLFHIHRKQNSSELSAETLKALITKFEDTVAIIVDERSMISAHLLGTMEAYCRQAAFKGQNKDLSWGGLPIIILVGDD